MRLLALPVLFVAVGCGSDGTKKPMLLDAKVFLDAGIDAAPACSVMASLGSLTIGAAAPAMGNYFSIPMTGPDTGKKQFNLAGNLPSSTATEKDQLIIEYQKPVGGFALTPKNFEPSANAPTTVDAFLLGDVTGMPPNSNIAHFYWATTGALTLTAIGEADGNPIMGSVSMSNLGEIDQMTGAPIAGGCATVLGGLTFNLIQKAAFVGDGQPQTVSNAGNELQPMSPEEWQVALGRIEQYKAQEAAARQ